MLSDGWAPRSSLRGKRREEKKRNLSFPPGQSDEFSSLKAEGRLCSFHGAPWSPWSPSAWKPLLRHVCVWRELKAASLRWTCGSRTYEAEAKNSLAAANRLPGSSLFSRGGSGGLCWRAASRSFRGERLRKCSWHVSLHGAIRPAATGSTRCDKDETLMRPSQTIPHANATRKCPLACRGVPTHFSHAPSCAVLPDASRQVSRSGLVAPL